MIKELIELRLLLAMWLTFAVLMVVIFACAAQQKRDRAFVVGTVWEADGSTAVKGIGGKDWWIECQPCEGNEKAVTVTYLGSAYRVEINTMLLRTPVVQMTLHDGPGKVDCVIERLVLNLRKPVEIDWAFMPKQ